MQQASLGPALGHAILRFLLGVNFFSHGLVRLAGDWTGFVTGVEKAFAEVILMPGTLVTAFAWFIAPFELVIGAMLILGWFQRESLVAGGLFLGALIFGTSMRQDWATVGLQMIYALCFYVLLLRLGDDRYSLDARRRS